MTAKERTPTKPTKRSNFNSAIPYRDALRWLLDNDDTGWLDHPADSGPGCISVTACLVADIYHRDNEQVRADLLKLKGTLI